MCLTDKQAINNQRTLLAVISEHCFGITIPYKI